MILAQLSSKYCSVSDVDEELARLMQNHSEFLNTAYQFEAMKGDWWIHSNVSAFAWASWLLCSVTEQASRAVFNIADCCFFYDKYLLFILTSVGFVFATCVAGLC